MNKHRRIWETVSVVLVMAAVVLFAASLFMGIGRANASSASADLGKRVEHRVQTLDHYIQKALSQDKAEWMQLDGLPEDMVVYR